VEHAALAAPAAAAVEAVAAAAFKALAYRTSKRCVADRHLAWQLAQHILLRSLLSVSRTHSLIERRAVIVPPLNVVGSKSVLALSGMDGDGRSGGDVALAAPRCCL
jgi:hypothetical protein